MIKIKKEREIAAITKYINNAYHRYLAFKYTKEYRENDLNELVELNQFVNSFTLSTSTVSEFLYTLSKHAHSVKKGDYIKLLECDREHADSFVSTILNLYDDALPLNKRILPSDKLIENDYIKKLYDPTVISYLLAAKDFQTYPLFNSLIFTELIRLLKGCYDVSKLKHDYLAYCSFMNFILENIKATYSGVTIYDIYDFLKTSISSNGLIVENSIDYIHQMIQQNIPLNQNIKFAYSRMQKQIYRLMDEVYRVKRITLMGEYGEEAVFEKEFHPDDGNYWLSISKEAIEYGYKRVALNSTIENVETIEDISQFSIERFKKKLLQVLWKYFLKNKVGETNDTKKDYTKQDFLDENFITEEQYDRLVKLLNYKQNLILQGPPGTGKTFTAINLAYSLIGQRDEERVQVVQFHQNYSYDDFMVGYRPDSNGTFTVRYGVFYKLCKTACTNPDVIYYLIIDEINRGNVGKIFGELFSLLESDKRGRKITLANGEDFIIPANLYIIGTMNTADRSVADLDIALRRRFATVSMVPMFNEKMEKYLLKNGISKEMILHLFGAIYRINSVICNEFHLGKPYEIGQAYFCHPLNGKSETEWLSLILEAEIRPLLETHFFDKPKMVEDLLGEFSFVFHGKLLSV